MEKQSINPIVQTKTQYALFQSEDIKKKISNNAANLMKFSIKELKLRGFSADNNDNDALNKNTTLEDWNIHIVSTMGVCVVETLIRIVHKTQYLFSENSRENRNLQKHINAFPQTITV